MLPGVTRIGLGLGATAAVLHPVCSDRAGGDGARRPRDRAVDAGSGARRPGPRAAWRGRRIPQRPRQPQLPARRPEPGQTVGDTARRLDADPAVALAEPDRVNDSAGVPDDPLFGSSGDCATREPASAASPPSRARTSTRPAPGCERWAHPRSWSLISTPATASSIRISPRSHGPTQERSPATGSTTTATG